MNEAANDTLADAPTAIPLSALPGVVGSQRAEQFQKLKLHTLEDLLLHRPKRYEDRRRFSRINEAIPDLPTVFRGTVQSVSLKKTHRRRLSLVEVLLGDETGELICRWWNQPYLAQQFQANMELLVYGKPSISKKVTVDQPETELIDEAEDITVHLNRIVPIYPLTKGLHQRWLRDFIWNTLEKYGHHITDLDLGIPFSSSLNRREAVQQLHFPQEMAQTIAAREYFSQEELLTFQLKLQTRRLRFTQKAKAPPCENSNQLIQPFLKQLPFTLTKAQLRVMKEIRHDLNRPSPMRRLLQGDVGSGKTAVAAMAAVIVIESGYDAALMAPTELLAKQHFHTFERWFGPLSINLGLLTGNTKPPAHDSEPGLTIGTHALLEDNYQPNQLGLVIIDEQHRFGVSQRDRLLKKGHYPHLLTMTATPIPRSLGLTVYGDLEHSVIDELPRHRGDIKTYVRHTNRLDRIWKFVRQKLEEGRQIYVVYPRIEGTEDDDIKSLQSELDKIKEQIAPFTAHWIHGQLPRDEAAQVMADFRANQIQVLVSTTVIEVGVDVANATVMLIENAERFGLAQLHQIRGRIGRGRHDSQCILVSHEKNEAAQKRLKILESTRDGFAIAEHDMKLRGPGEFLGKQQSGLPQFRFADLIRDRALVSEIRSLVRTHLGLSHQPK
ncbi:MAG: ATP-dependent DNA helicase RecG [Verrucomicrobia subdivision 3 bacterium]|nr:ATP-dependent DNA helicase RecG [Limisphaerales bacterium]MCS1415274.1 ATP-dependent DNA helicase RecG [Limisphaerales bacterium]